MKASVNFNHDVEPYNLKVSETNGHTVSFEMDGTTAVARTVSPPKGEDFVFIDRIVQFIEFAETLPFVQAVTFDGRDEESDEGDTDTFTVGVVHE